MALGGIDRPQTAKTIIPLLTLYSRDSSHLGNSLFPNKNNFPLLCRIRCKVFFKADGRGGPEKQTAGGQEAVGATRLASGVLLLSSRTALVVPLILAPQFWLGRCTWKPQILPLASQNRSPEPWSVSTSSQQCSAARSNGWGRRCFLPPINPEADFPRDILSQLESAESAQLKT